MDEATRWHEQYEALASEKKAQLELHLDLSTSIGMWERCINHLMDEFHAKKAVCVDGTYRMGDRATDRFYEAFFFRGRNEVSSMQPFPCAFQSDLETLLERTVTHSLGSGYNGFVTAIYYRARTIGLSQNRFDPVAWPIERDERITEADRLVLRRFSDGFTQFMQRAIDLLEAASIDAADERDELARTTRYHKKAMALLK